MRKQIHCYIRGGQQKQVQKQASSLKDRYQDKQTLSLLFTDTYISFYYLRTCLLNKNDVFKLAILWVRYFVVLTISMFRGYVSPNQIHLIFGVFVKKKGGDLHQRWWTKNKLNCLSLGSHWSQKTNQICIPFSKACLLLKLRLCYLKISFSFEVFWVQRQAHFHYNLLSTFLSNSFLCWDWH